MGQVVIKLWFYYRGIIFHGKGWYKGFQFGKGGGVSGGTGRPICVELSKQSGLDGDINQVQTG